MDGLPFIAVNISQPGDKGEFHISVSDIRTRQVILTNRLKENRSAFDYLYNLRLIEGSGARVAFKKEGISEVEKQERLQDIIRYGQNMYQDLFGRDDKLKQYLAKQPHLAKGACIVLRLFDTASELWNIPWEYIHDGTQFLGLNPKFPILRYLVDSKPTTLAADLTQLPSPLRILFVISNPRNAPPLNVEAEINRIQRAVKPAIDKGLVEIEYVERGTLKNIENALSKRDFHILHYSGHGAIATKGSLLVMENEAGMGAPVSLDELLPVVSKAQNLRLVFLSACKSGNINETIASSGIATGLMRVVPAVLAMQFSIWDDSATKLAEAFYGQIGRGATLEEALFASRQTLYQHNQWLNDWGVPALYINKPNIRLVDVTKEGKTISDVGRPDVSALPYAEPFIGRREEQNTLRTLLANGEIPFVYIWGMAGVGKSALVHQIIKRPGQDVVINDVLTLRCDQMSIQAVIATFQKWMAQHFPATRPLLADLPKSPREVIRQIEEHVKGKRLILILDHVDKLMTHQDDRYVTFTDPIADEFFMGLARADWSVTTIITARFLWHYTTQIPENSFKDIHVNNLSPTDIGFIVTERDIFREQDEKLLNNFFNMVGGHPATLEYIAKLLVSKPDLLEDPRLKVSLVNYWHKSFLGATLALLTEPERALLKLMCIHDSFFSPSLVQIYGNLTSRESAAYMMVVWELLSLADFLGTDSDDVTWYIIPHAVRTYLTSSMDEDEKKNLHTQFGEVLQAYFFDILQSALKNGANKGAVLSRRNEFATVLAHLHYFLQHPDPQYVTRYLNLTITWQNHFRKAGMVEQANQIILAFIGILHDFGNIEATDELIKIVRESGKLSVETDIQMRYWSAVRLIDARDYARASKVMDVLDGQTKDKKSLETLHANIIERQGEIARGLGDAKRTEQKWLQALDEYEVLGDRLGTARVLFYFVEEAYYVKNLEKAQSRLEKALKLLNDGHQTGPGMQLQGKLILYQGHIARLMNKGGDALAHYTRLCRIGMRIGDSSLLAQGLEHLGYYYGLLKQYEIASNKLLHALDLYEKLNDQTGLSLVLMKLAVVHDFWGKPKEAYTFCQRAHRIAEKNTLGHLKDAEALLKRLKNKAG